MEPAASVSTFVPLPAVDFLVAWRALTEFSVCSPLSHINWWITRRVEYCSGWRGGVLRDLILKSARPI
jgi:hypothetical protein